MKGRISERSVTSSSSSDSARPVRWKCATPANSPELWSEELLKHFLRLDVAPPGTSRATGSDSRTFLERPRWKETKVTMKKDTICLWYDDAEERPRAFTPRLFPIATSVPCTGRRQTFQAARRAMFDLLRA